MKKLFVFCYLIFAATALGDAALRHERDKFCSTVTSSPEAVIYRCTLLQVEMEPSTFSLARLVRMPLPNGSYYGYENGKPFRMRLN